MLLHNFNVHFNVLLSYSLLNFTWNFWIGIQCLMQVVGGERLEASQALLLRVTHWELKTSGLFIFSMEEGAFLTAQHL